MTCTFLLYWCKEGNAKFKQEKINAEERAIDGAFSDAVMKITLWENCEET